MSRGLPLDRPIEWLCVSRRLTYLYRRNLHSRSPANLHRDEAGDPVDLKRPNPLRARRRAANWSRQRHYPVADLGRADRHGAQEREPAGDFVLHPKVEWRSLGDPIAWRLRLWLAIEASLYGTSVTSRRPLSGTKDEPDSFIALDGDVEIGIVKFVPASIDAGSWGMWSMLLSHPGPVFKTPTSGIKPTRKEAARELLDCWRAFRMLPRRPRSGEIIARSR